MRHEYGMIYMDIYYDLLGKFYSGVYQYGDKLPPVWQLCEQYGSGINAMRKTFKRMREEGLITTESRNGTTVRFDPSKPAHFALLRFYRVNYDRDRFNTLHIPAVFISSMSGTGILAATPQERSGLVADLAVLLANVNQGRHWGDLTTKFFTKLISLARNSFFNEIFDDLARRFVLFVPPEKLDERACSRHQEVCIHYFTQMKTLLQEDRLREVKPLVRAFYEAVYHIPNVLLFSSTNQSVMDLGQETQYSKIAQKINLEILFGELKKGDLLPTQDQLCTQYHVGRNTILKACELLKEMGLIESRFRGGTIVTADWDVPEIREKFSAQMAAVRKETAEALVAVWSVTRDLCVESMKYATEEVWNQMQSNLDDQWRLAQAYNQPMMVTDALVTPLVECLKNSRLRKYYYYLISPLRQFIGVRALFRQVDCSWCEQVYSTASQAVTQIRQQDPEGFIRLFREAGLLNSKLYEVLDEKLTQNIGKWDISAEDT